TLDKYVLTPMAYGLDNMETNCIIVAAMLKDDGTLYPIGKDAEGHYSSIVVYPEGIGLSTSPYESLMATNGTHSISNLKEYNTNRGNPSITYRYEFSDVKVKNDLS